MLSTTLTPAQLAREQRQPAALAAWLEDRGATAPWFGAEVWRTWVTRADAAQLLAELDHQALTPRIAAVFETGGITLYLWPLRFSPDPVLRWLLRSYDAGATIVEADAVRGSGIWATGKALKRLLGSSAEAAHVARAVGG